MKSYYSSNGKIPSSVSAGGYSYSVPEFLYLMAQAISQLGNSNTNAITCLYGIKAPSSPSGDTIYSEELYIVGTFDKLFNKYNTSHLLANVRLCTNL